MPDFIGIVRTALVLVTLPAGSACQAAPTIPSEQSCRSCRIVLDPVVTLGRGDGPSLMRRSTVAVDSRGNYYVAPTYNTGEIARYDPRGRYVGKFGREGRGPGEFGNFIHRIVVGPEDSVHVFEGNRHTVLAPSLSAVASVRMPPCTRSTSHSFRTAAWWCRA